MGGLAGFTCLTQDLSEQADEKLRILTKMREALQRRGGSQNGEWLTAHCGLAATWRYDAGLAVMPYTRRIHDTTYTVVFDGEIYNRDALWALFPEERLHQGGDAALILLGFAAHGPDFVKSINGVFAFAVWHEDTLHLFRDHAGVKPLFYTRHGDTFLFASEMKALFQYPGVEARLDAAGMAALLALSPAREAHSGVFKNMYALPPGCLATVREDIQITTYWDLHLRPVIENEADIVARVRNVMLEAITTQTSDEVCSLLSGGVDSSVVTAVAASVFKAQGKKLHTYSFDFVDGERHFKANAFQPDRDRPWVDAMVNFCQTEHTYLECGPDALAAALADAVLARDLPGMADIDASLLYFCSRLPEGIVALTGECADEVFGGYPWFHRPELTNADGFPWSYDAAARKSLFSEDWLQSLDFDNRFNQYYRESLAQAEQIAGDATQNPEEHRLRVVSYLTIKWFMTTLTDRMDRMGAYAGIGARVPFADIRLMNDVWNAPWALKRKDGVVKYLLREAARGLLPEDVLFRKKSPFPKTYDPTYFQIVAAWLEEDVLTDPNAPVRAFIDKDSIRDFISRPANVSRPWFGQLMAGPQRLAWLWQFNYWLKTYRVHVEGC